MQLILGTAPAPGAPTRRPRRVDMARPASPEVSCFSRPPRCLLASAARTLWSGIFPRFVLHEKNTNFSCNCQPSLLSFLLMKTPGLQPARSGEAKPSAALVELGRISRPEQHAAPRRTGPKIAFEVTLSHRKSSKVTWSRGQQGRKMTTR